jgi:hypothetical protein
MPATSVKVEETEKGARLILTPTDSAQLEALREHARWHAERMQSHECWMLQDAATAKRP